MSFEFRQSFIHPTRAPCLFAKGKHSFDRKLAEQLKYISVMFAEAANGMSGIKKDL